jgi:hypothetical protein
MKIDADIDIDVQQCKITDIFTAVPAARFADNKIHKHPVGYYFQNIPVDPVSKFAAIPYEESTDYGYFKIDFLHLSVLDQFTSKQEIKQYLKQEPDWSLLADPQQVAKLFQIHSHFKLIDTIKPKSINELADCIALIRPGKRFLLDKYLTDKTETCKLLYTKTASSDYRKSHAIAYAHVIVLQLHLIKDSRL